MKLVADIGNTCITIAIFQDKKIVKKFNSIKEKIAKAGGVIHVISDKESYSKVEDCLPKFINTIGLKNPSPKASRSDESRDE